MIRWHLAPEWSGPPPRLAEWCAAGLAQVVKQAPHRTIWRVAVDGLDLHVKSYREDARRWLRGLRARREFDITHEVARRGVPTLDVLAWGEDGACSYLVSRSLSGALSLLDLLQGPIDVTARQELAQALGEFLARVHRAGVRHDDLHPGNLLVCREGPSTRLFLIDLGEVRLGAPLSWRACRDNLVVLNRWFTLRASSSERFRIWRAYSRAAALVDEKEGARAIEQQTRRSLLHFSDRLDRRCLGGNRHFRRVRGPDVQGLTVSDVDVSALLADPDVPFHSGEGKYRVLKRSPSSVVIETVLAGREVIYKRHAVTTWSDLMASMFRPPPALRAYVMGHALRLRGLPTPRPLGVWHRHRLGLAAEGYLLVEKVPEAQELTAFVEYLASRPPDEGRRRLMGLIEQLARLMRQFHGWNLSHRDLKSANVLVSPQAWVAGERGIRETGPDGGDHVWFVDLVGVRKQRRLGRGQRARNLARLNASFLGSPLVSRTARLRFLIGYLGMEGGDWKTWWKRVEEATRAKLERNRRLGRPLS
jgi:tRNA A-37 threonylcarbamoyl transferase component Bud32